MKKKSAKNTDQSMRDMAKTIGNRFLEIQKNAEKHGIFLNHRELLECQCGLKEDITTHGKLIVCRKSAVGVDIGLLFPEPDKSGKSRCPGCGRIVKVKL